MMLVPGMAVVALSVLTIDRSPVGFRSSSSVEDSLPGLGSFQPEGGVMVAVLVSLADPVFLPPGRRRWACCSLRYS